MLFSDLNVLQVIDPITMIPKRITTLSTINGQMKGVGFLQPFYDRRHHETIYVTMEPGSTGRYHVFSIKDHDSTEPVVRLNMYIEV